MAFMMTLLEKYEYVYRGAGTHSQINKTIK